MSPFLFKQPVPRNGTKSVSKENNRLDQSALLPHPKEEKQESRHPRNFNMLQQELEGK